jgi:hypothetical protein
MGVHVNALCPPAFILGKRQSLWITTALSGRMSPVCFQTVKAPFLPFDG